MAITFRLLSGVVLVGSLIFAGCESTTPTQTTLTNEEQTDAEGPGAFGVSLLKGLSKRSAKTAVQTDPVVSFDLGNIKGSTAFYFIVVNVGKAPIKNISFTVDDSSFSVFPNKIDILVPGNDLNIMPIIKTVVYHGTPIEGAGTRPLLKQGVNNAVVTIRGITKTCTGIDTTITLSTKLQLTALVMDLQISSSFGGPYKLPVVKTGRSELHFPDGNFYQFSSGIALNYKDSVVMLKNTGNVPLSYKIFKSDDQKWNGYTVALQDSLIGTLKNGESLIVPHKYVPGVDHTLEHFFFLSGNNTAYDPKKLPVGEDGVIRFTTNQYMPATN